jgi:hypothetical protein
MGKRETVLIFAGAGASKGVSEEKYPTTKEFFELLPGTITKSKVFQRLIQRLKSIHKTNVIDVEMFLWELGEFESFLIKATQTAEIGGYFLGGNNLGDAVGVNANFGNLSDVLGKGLAEVKRLKEQTNKLVYDLYSDPPSEAELRETWIPLLTPILNEGHKIELVTTNYDLVLEEAVEILNPEYDLKLRIDTGWRGRAQRILDIDAWYDDTSTAAENGMLTKLHGSVNWKNKDEKVLVGDAIPGSRDDQQVIIYPGFKGAAEGPIFKPLHDHFGKALASSKVCVFIGFAFRDGYINQVCERYGNDSQKIIILNPEKPDQVPFSENSKFLFQDYFAHDTATQVAAKALELLRK